jgi:hypothetical protein
MKTLPRPPGLVGEICDWIDSTARKPQPVLSLAASLAYCGALMGRKVQNEWELRTNLYTMGVGESCSGKEHARTAINKLTTLADMNKLIGGEDVTSDAAIEMELFEHKTIFYLWDEVGHMMANIKSSGGGGHTAKIVPMLMKMYTSSNKMYNGKSYANKEEGKRQIDQPHCCIYGTTVPGRLYDGMDTSELIDGWLGRVLVFRTEEDPDIQYEASKARPVPEGLIDQVRWWGAYQPAPDLSRGDIVAAMTNKPTTIKMTPDAQLLLEAFDTFTANKRREARIDGLGIDNLWGRTGENATKIAMIIGCGKGEPFIIDEESVQCAIEITMTITEQLASDIRANVGDNDNDRNRKKILKIIKKAGKNGISKRDLTRKTQWSNRMARDNMLSDLEDAEEIEKATTENGKDAWVVCR